MRREKLVGEIRSRRSCLCVGLDLDLSRLPEHLSEGPGGWLDFNREIVDATRDLCVAYKPNWAFYEALGEEGMRVLKATIEYIGEDHLIIADAKRGDIGNTSRQYARAIFNGFGADAITVSPYMGRDSLEPFRTDGKWLIALVLTSNPGSADFQRSEMKNGKSLYEHVLSTLAEDFSAEEMMFVVGATHPEQFKNIRSYAPDHFLLVPGVGAQGGDLQSVMKNGSNNDVGLLVNSSRSIIYAGGGKDFADMARQKANEMQSVMSKYIV